MFRILIILGVISAVLAGTIVPRNDNTQENQQQPLLTSSTQNQMNNQLQMYSGSQGNQLSPAQYYYPTYPEYVDNGYSTRSEGASDGYLFPLSASTEKQQWIPGATTSLIPLASSVLAYGSQLGSYFLHFTLALILGGVLTTLICTFTPLCSISFLGLGLTKSQVQEQVADLARTFITPESINTATVLVSKAIDKYTAMQRENHEERM